MDLNIFVSANKALGRVVYQLLICCHGKKCHDQKQLTDVLMLGYSSRGI